MPNENIKLRENHTQVCIWPGTVLGKEPVKDFEKYFLEEFKVRAQYLEEIKTKPDLEDGELVIDTGGRNDIFFAVHPDDITNEFAGKRLYMGIRWIEDVLAEVNYHSPIYPERVFDYCSWNEGALAVNR